MDLHKVVAKTQKNTNTLPALHFARDVFICLKDLWPDYQLTLLFWQT